MDVPGDNIGQALGASELAELMALGLPEHGIDLPPKPPHDPSLPQLDGYEITSLLGEGGMGAVWRAVQVATHREVALKLVGHTPVALRKARLRFEREVELAGRLQHPYIARVYDSGVYRGQCYYAMELVHGVHLDRYVTNRELPTDEVLQLVIRVCEAVQHAHTKGVLHRDLKPSNILVTDDGQPHLVDFGLARALVDDAPGLSVTTEGQYTGTLEYMSPEQAAGRLDGLDTRTDVYGLGATLYRLLLGRPPHDASGPRQEVLRRITEEDPPRPRQLDRKLDRELEALLLKSLDRNPDRRYASVAELAQDVHKYLHHEPLIARKAGWLYVGRKRLRKHWRPVLLTFVVLSILAAVGLESVRRINKARGDAVTALGVAQSAQQSEASHRHQAELRLADSYIAQGDALGQAGKWWVAADRYRSARGVLESLPASTLPAEMALCQAYAESPPPLLTFGRISSGEWLSAVDASAESIALSPDGRTAFRVDLTPDGEGGISVWDVATGRLIRTFGQERGIFMSVALSADGSKAVTGRMNSISVWDVKTGRELGVVPKRLDIIAYVRVAFIGDSGKVLVGSGHRINQTGVLGLADPGSGRGERTTDEAVSSMAVSRDGTAVLSAHYSGVARLWKFAGDKLVPDGTLLDWSGPVNHDWPRAVCFSPDGTRVAVGNDNALTATILVFDRATHKQICRLNGHSGAINHLVILPDGRTLVSCSDDGTIRMWDIQDARLLRTFVGHDGVARSLSVSADGRIALSEGSDGLLKLWDLTADEDAVWAAHLRKDGPGSNVVCLRPDGLTGVSGGYDGKMRLWDLASRKLLRTSGGHEGTISNIALSYDGRRVLTKDLWGFFATWDLTAGTRLFPFGHQNTSGVAISPDNRFALNGYVLRDLSTGNEIRSLGQDIENAVSAFSPDGRRALVGNRPVFLYDVATGEQLLGLQVTPGAAPRDVKFLPDGRRAVSADTDHVLRLWDLATGKEIGSFRGHSNAVMTVSVSRDGRLVASGSVDGTARVWDLEGRRELRTFPLADSMNYCKLSLAADGSALLVPDGERIRYWDFRRPSLYRQFEPRLKEAMSALEKNPDDLPALKVLGEWYAFRGRCDWAASLLERVPERDRSSLMLARCYWRTGRLDEALAQFRQAEKRGEAQRDYLRLCARALAEEKISVGAGKTSAAADEDLLFHHSAPQYLRAGKLDRVLRMGEWWRRAAPRRFVWWALPALIEVRLGHLDQYRALRREMLSLFGDDRDNEVALCASAYSVLLPADDSEQLAHVEALALRAQKAFPDYPDGTLVLAECRYRAGRYADAEQLLRQPFAHDERYPLRLFWLSMALEQQNRHDEAKRALAQAVTEVTSQKQPNDFSDEEMFEINWKVATLCQIARQEAEGLILGRTPASRPATADVADLSSSVATQP